MILNVLFSMLFAIVGGSEANRKRIATVTLSFLGGAGSFALYSNACNPQLPPEPPTQPTATSPAPIPPVPPPSASVPSEDAGTPPVLDGGVEPPEPAPKPECKFKKPKIARSLKDLIEAFIVGGTDALPGEFPFATSMQTNAGDHFCGGSVFRDQWILTAAHCVEVFASFKVVVGRHDLRTVEGNEYQVSANDVRVHPLYGTNPAAEFDYDVALVKLPQKAAVPSIQLHVGTTTGLAYAIGWGRQKSGGALSPTLKKVAFPIVDQMKCKGFYGDDLTNRMICGDRVGEGSCQGDSGGALLFKVVDNDEATLDWRIAGDVSWGVDCAAGWPGVYGRLTSPELGPQAVLAEWVDSCAEPA